MRIAALVKQIPCFEEMELGADGRLVPRLFVAVTVQVYVRFRLGAPNLIELMVLTFVCVTPPFDDVPEASYVDPALTTVRQPKFRLGVAAVDSVNFTARAVPSVLSERRIFIEPLNSRVFFSLSSSW